jgi:hypothetical protein
MPAESRRTAHVVYLRIFLPERPDRTAGVFLLDDFTGNLYFRIREDWPAIAGEADAQVLAEMGADFRRRVEALDDGGGAEFLASLEDQLSNVVRLSERETVEMDDIRSTLDRLFEAHCQS